MNYNNCVKPSTTNDLKNKVKSSFLIATSNNDNQSNSTSEQLKEIETVIHRSEMYLAHQHNNHNGGDSSSKSRFPNGHTSAVGGTNGNVVTGHYHRSNSGRSSTTSSGAYGSSDKLPSSTSTSDDVDELAGE